MNPFLNFISEEDRASLTRVLIFRISNKVLVLLLVVVVIFSFTLFGANYLMEQEIDRVKTEQQNTRVLINGDENTTIESAIEDLNAKISRLADIQEDYVPWTAVFEKFETVATAGVHFSSKEIELLSDSTSSMNCKIEMVSLLKKAVSSFDALS